MRDRYISNNPLEKIEDYLALFRGRTAGVEIIPTEDALGRVLSRAVYAKLCDPVYNAAAMDGIAVSSETTAKARRRSFLKKDGISYTSIPAIPYRTSSTR